jgi:hypothetical protein
LESNNNANGDTKATGKGDTKATASGKAKAEMDGSEIKIWRNISDNEWHKLVTGGGQPREIPRRV